ncbi:MULTISPECIES: hypothetical protein [unclassified Streptomyces]|uniref:hypothetical protein n=1 Tax=unclassified Streptomyces TaxID=2593676 RepID=UPI00224D944A|nr:MULTISPECIES: hypothetical protein [unclassified Streptomyces]MCX4526018.1 hypothetical protein [Streptomyces sp. NBC_01551]MCX4543418.1 hypothetical protein [Streptomyces sp. NBC_01565]
MTAVSTSLSATLAATARLAATGLCCLALAACGTRVAGQTAAAPPSAAPAAPTCTPNLPTEEDTGTPNIPTEEDTGTPNIPTEEDTGTPNIPTEEDTGTPNIPTEEDTGTPDVPTEEDTGGPNVPTDGSAAAPCAVVAGWYDMTRDFNAYYAAHRTDADHFVARNGVKEVRVRKTAKTSEAWVTFSTGSVGKGLAEDARRIAAVFGAWRHEIYGDTGTVGVRTEEDSQVVTTW